MATKVRLFLSSILVVALALTVVTVVAAPQGSGFTYQGRLENGGTLVSGNCDFQFGLWDAAVDGTQLGSTQALAGVPVEAGYFTVQLNEAGQFGAGAFQGDERHLEIQVRCPAGTGDYTSLGRQALAGTPYAHYALGAPWSGLIGMPGDFADGIDHDTTYQAGIGLGLDRGEFSIAPSFQLPQGCGSGGIAEYDSRAGLWRCGVDDSGAGGTYWSLGGNLGTDSSSHYLGTSDAISLTLRVNGTTALRLVPTSGTPNLIGGSELNSMAPSVVAAAIGGGSDNHISGHGAVIGGGAVNVAEGDVATIGGGKDNQVLGNFGTIGGGGGLATTDGNTVTDDGGTVGGGARNQAGDGTGSTATATHATTGGGYENTASGQYATVAGGYGNVASMSYTAVGGGQNNNVSAAYGTIAGGGDSDPLSGNYVADNWGTVGGGSDNYAGSNDGDLDSAAYATIAGGHENVASGLTSAIGGGHLNTASNDYATVGGGRNNTVSGSLGTIGGGGGLLTGNVVSDVAGVVGGGSANKAGDEDGDPSNAGFATVGGGWENTASGYSASVAGGWLNQATGYVTTIGGGYSNEANLGLCNRRGWC